MSTIDGPPFLSGKPHLGHALVMTYKDVIRRYNDKIDKIGFDTHGVPVETAVEKIYKINKSDKDYISKCKKYVFDCLPNWEQFMDKLNLKYDFKNRYLTCDTNYEKLCKNILIEINSKGYLYNDFKICAYSPKLQTTLSNMEAGLNYKEVSCNALNLIFNGENNLKFKVFTTTPWTLVTNYCLAINKNFDYYIDENNVVSLNNEDKYVKKISGKDLLGIKYNPLSVTKHKKINGLFKIIHADFVDKTGTGIVHINPYFGENDNSIVKLFSKEKFDSSKILNKFCKFQEGFDEFSGKSIEDVNKIVIKSLRDSEIIKIKHLYPFCYRTNVPLIYRTVDAWFIKVPRERLIELNKKVNWISGGLRFNNWISSAKDWCISRSRKWGIKLPIWKNSEGDYKMEYCENYEQVPYVFDCWFESACAQFLDDISNPVDYVIEGIDQTRGWFYTLLILSTIIKDDIPYKNVISTGLLLGKNGKKLSKKNGDTFKFSEEESDKLRLYLMSLSAINGESCKIKQSAIKSLYSNILIKFKNIIKFYQLYAKYDKIELSQNTFDYELNNRLDKFYEFCNIKLRKFEIFGIVSYLEKIISFVSVFIHYNRNRISKNIIPYNLIGKSIVYIQNILKNFCPMFYEKNKFKVEYDNHLKLEKTNYFTELIEILSKLNPKYPTLNIDIIGINDNIFNKTLKECGNVLHITNDTKSNKFKYIINKTFTDECFNYFIKTQIISKVNRLRFTLDLMKEHEFKFFTKDDLVKNTLIEYNINNIFVDKYKTYNKFDINIKYLDYNYDTELYY